MEKDFEDGLVLSDKELELVAAGANLTDDEGWKIAQALINSTTKQKTYVPYTTHKETEGPYSGWKLVDVPQSGGGTYQLYNPDGECVWTGE